MNQTVTRFARWVFQALTSEDGHPPKYSAVCRVLDCGEASPQHDDPRHAEMWAMNHAAACDRRGETHLMFGMRIESDAVCRPAVPGN